MKKKHIHYVIETHTVTLIGWSWNAATMQKKNIWISIKWTSVHWVMLYSYVWIAYLFCMQNSTINLSGCKILTLQVGKWILHVSDCTILTLWVGKWIPDTVWVHLLYGDMTVLRARHNEKAMSTKYDHYKHVILPDKKGKKEKQIMISRFGNWSSHTLRTGTWLLTK